MQSTTPKGTRRHACIRGLVAMTLAVLTSAAFAQAPAPTTTLQQQRDKFRAAWAAARNGRDWRPLATGLQDYPLYPYLEGIALKHDIKTASRANIDAYLQRYAGMIPARDLRKAELRQLAKDKDWTAFRHFYQPGLGDSLTCDHLKANLAEGKPLDFQRDLAALWQETHLPSACNPVLNAAHAQGLLTTQRVWDRIERAADAHRSSAIRQSADWLTDSDATEARRIAEAISSPSTLLAHAKRFADTPRNREAISRALERLAHRHSAKAISEWDALSTQFRFDEPQRDRVLAALALYNAVDFGPGALTRLAALPASAQTDATREWRVRAAVAQGNWQAAQTAIDALTPDEMQHDEWRYWKARIAQKLGHASAALDGYSAVAQTASFYGFLAADRANLPYSICPATIPADAARDAKLEATPGLQRAFEFFALDMLPQARREWSQAFDTLTPTQKKQAAALASRKGWYSRAVFALGKLDEHAYALRFPLADRQRVVAAAQQAGIRPSWAFAIIRAESAWEPDAHSGANARGLMQLLPSTAAMVARRNDLPYDGSASLYDPAINIPLGTQYLAKLATRYNGSPWLASAAYNAGPGNVGRWVDARGSLDPEVFILNIPFNATRAYVTRILSFATIYDWQLHGQPVPVSSRMPAIGTAYDPSNDPARKQVVCRVSAAPASAATAASARRSAPASPATAASARRSAQPTTSTIMPGLPEGQSPESVTRHASPPHAVPNPVRGPETDSGSPLRGVRNDEAKSGAPPGAPATNGGTAR